MSRSEDPAKDFAKLRKGRSGKQLPPDLLLKQSLTLNILTGPFLILSPRDQESGKFYVVQKRHATDSELLKYVKSLVKIDNIFRNRVIQINAL